MDNMQPIMTIDADGDKVWRLNHAYHRTDGPAIEWHNGDTSWYLHGVLHRTNGPAREWTNNRKEWWQYGNRHRTDGPAIEYANGHKSWHLRDKRMTLNEWLDQNQTLTGEEKVMYKLEYG
jgi:hypothetical protein